MSKKEDVTLYFINHARKTFRNTWVHRIPLTSIIYRHVFAFGYGGVEKEIAFRNAKYLVPTTDSAVVPSMISGDYENYELNLFSQILNKGDTVLDIGANIGVYCIEASRKIGDKGKVFSFEPIEENLKLLEHNLKLNNIKNVKIVPYAIGNKQGILKIYKAKNSIATHSAGAISDNFEEINVTTIDDFVSKSKIKVNLIKMDIEGYEGHAVEGGIKTIKKYKPILFIEFSSDHLKRCGYSVEKHAKNLLKLYKFCYLVDERKQLLTEISDYKVIVKLRNDNLILSPKPLVIK